MQIEVIDASVANTCPVGLGDIRSLLGPSPDKRYSDHCLVAHAGGCLLGAMRIAFPHYPSISAEAPVVCRDAAPDAVAGALLGALQHEALKRGCIGIELVHDLLPSAESREAVTRRLAVLGFDDMGRSIFLSKNLGPDSMLDDPRMELVTAKEYGIDRFIRAVVACAQAPIADYRTQPCCVSPEGAALITRDLAGNDAGEIDPDQCRMAIVKGAVVAVAIADSGFVKWIAVQPEARRTGIGRRVLLALEHIWAAQGIRRAGLQVLSTNTGAAALYAGLDYASHGENSPRIWRWHIMDWR